MVNKLHDGLTLNPDDTLPDGSQEIETRDLFSGKYALGTIMRQLYYKRIRARLKKMRAEGRWDLPDKGSDPLLAELLEIIRVQQQRGTVVSVLAPWHGDKTLQKGEGYMRRVLETDKRILSDFFCIYFYECPYYRVTRIVADRVSDNRIYIRYNANYASQRAFVETLIAASGICYSHSALRIIPYEKPEQHERWLNIFKDTTRHILDIHGAIVEEAKLCGTSTCEWTKKAEALYFENIDNAVVVTQSMWRYFSEKYDCANISFFLIPFMSKHVAKDNESILKTDPPVIVYSGGCQPWQNIPLMQQAIKRQPNLNYYMLVSEPEIFIERWGKAPIPKNMMVHKLNAEKIRNIYHKAHYGFVLRDDSIINRVACPAKIAEYIQFGIVPIMKFAEIGDFKALGLKYWPIERFINGELPQEQERRLMAQSNFDMIRCQRDDSFSLKESKVWATGQAPIQAQNRR